MLKLGVKFCAQISIYVKENEILQLCWKVKSQVKTLNESQSAEDAGEDNFQPEMQTLTNPNIELFQIPPKQVKI